VYNLIINLRTDPELDIYREVGIHRPGEEKRDWGGSMAHNAKETR